MYSESIDFGIDDAAGMESKSAGILRSAHKYVNAIQVDNEALKVVRRRSCSCVPANSIAVVHISCTPSSRKGNLRKRLSSMDTLNLEIL